jgi:uncharacterized protein DUF2721
VAEVNLHIARADSRTGESLEMPTEPEISNLAHIIQLSVSPVFLLTGVASFLGVLTNRLSRIIDRARTVESSLAENADAGEGQLRSELTVLEMRMWLINRAISLSTIAALMVATVIAAMFLSGFVQLDLTIPVACGFIAAMGSLICGLLCFLREVRIAIGHMHAVRPRLARN